MYGVRVPASCGPYVPGAQGSLPLGPVHGTRAPYLRMLASGVPCVPGAQGSLPLGPVHGTRAPYAC